MTFKNFFESKLFCDFCDSIGASKVGKKKFILCFSIKILKLFVNIVNCKEKNVREKVGKG